MRYKIALAKSNRTRWKHIYCSVFIPFLLKTVKIIFCIESAKRIVCGKKCQVMCNKNVNVKRHYYRWQRSAHANTHKTNKQQQHQIPNNVNCVQFVSIEQFAFYRFFFASALFAFRDFFFRLVNNNILFW